MTITDQAPAQQETAADMGSKQDLLDFLVTEEQLGVTLVGAAIQNAPGTPSEGFLPVLKNGVTTEYHHVEALKEAGGERADDQLLAPRRRIRRGWHRPVRDPRAHRDDRDQPLPHRRQCLRARGRRLRRAALRRGDGHRGRAPRARALRQGEIWAARTIGAPNDVGIRELRLAHGRQGPHSRSRSSASATGPRRSQPGKFYEYPGDPLASGVGTPVNHTNPA